MKIVGGSDKAKPLSPEQRQARKRGMLFGAFVSDQLRKTEMVGTFAEELRHLCNVEHGREVGVCILTFRMEAAATTIRVMFGDEQSGAHLAITNMTTLPDAQKSKGFGSKALQVLLNWAQDRGLNDIQAVQVQKRSEGFWIKNGFVRIGNITNDFRYSRT